MSTRSRNRASALALADAVPASALPRTALPATGLLPRPLAGRLDAFSGEVQRRPWLGRLALVAIAAAALLVVAAEAARPSVLVPRSQISFPGWMAGPLGGALGAVHASPDALSIGLTGAAALMLLAYAVALASARALPPRAIAAFVVAVHLVMLLSPPGQLTDVFNYLGYARLGALHHLNPYTNVIADISRDPVYRLSTWHHLRSPYGPAFSAVTYPLGLLPLPVAYWLLKAGLVACSLALVAIVADAARRLGRDPRFAVLFIAANPIVVLYALGGFHNDVVMLVPLLGAVALLLARRERQAGAMLAIAVAMKFTAVLLIPFLVLAARPAARRRRLLEGIGLAAVPLIAGDLALFGLALPNLSDQTSLLTDFSVPNLLGISLGLGGGTPELIRAMTAGVVVLVAVLIRRRTDWLAGAGWATLALIGSLAWLMPWYVEWLLPLAALAVSSRLRAAALALTVFLLLSFVPATWIAISQLRIAPMSGAPGKASTARQDLLER